MPYNISRNTSIDITEILISEDILTTKQESTQFEFQPGPSYRN
jgi:hypothetical protein